MVELGFVSERETKAVIYIKDECKKRFIFNANMLGKSSTSAPAAPAIELNSEYENTTTRPDSGNNSSQLVLLRQEIFDLQKKLRDIAKIIKR